MQHDREHGLLRFTDEERDFANCGSVLPVEEADLVLEAALRARNRANAIDPSEFPRGAHRTSIEAAQQKANIVAGRLINQLTTIVTPGVVEEAETILKNNS